MHMMKSTDKHFKEFGEIYFSSSWPVSIKAWHIHQSMTINNAVISGNAKLVMYDPNKIIRLDPFTDKIPYSWDFKKVNQN